MRNIIIIPGYIEPYGIKKLERALKGYKIFHFRNNITETVSKLSKHLHDFIENNNIKEADFVVHSMGSLILRYFLTHYKFKCKRVVMLSPANKSLKFPKLFKKNNITKKFMTFLARELTWIERFRLKKIKADVGIIRGVYSSKRKNHYAFFWKLLDKPNDGIISHKEMQLKEAKDIIDVDEAHWFLPSNKRAIKEVKHFLKNGRFSGK